METQSASPSTVPQQDQERPWTPNQLFASGFIFGPVGGGVAAGLNAKRLGKPQLLVPMVLLGVALFLIETAVLLFAVADSNAKLVGISFGLGSGVLFQMLQKPLFNSWKATHWVKPPDGRYKPTKIGLLFGAGLACLAAEAAVIFAFVMLAPAGWIKL